MGKDRCHRNNNIDVPYLESHTCMGECVCSFIPGMYISYMLCVSGMRRIMARTDGADGRGGVAWLVSRWPD